MQTIFTVNELKENYNKLLSLLSNVQQDSRYVKEAFSQLEKIPAKSIPGDIAGQARAIAVTETMKGYTQNHQKLLEICETMYDDLRTVMFQPDVNTD